MQKTTFFQDAIVVLIAVLMAAVLLGGCGAGGDASTGTPTDASSVAGTYEAGAAPGAGPTQGGEAPAGPETGAAVTEAPRVGPGSEPTGGGTVASPVPVLTAVVTRVVDGDTVHVRLDDGSEEKVRFIGVDTPESTTQVEPYGKEAAAYTESRLDGKKVHLELDAGERDKYGRLLAYVWLAPPADGAEAEVRGKMFNAELLLAGMAQVMTVPPNVKYADLFGKLQREAREAGTGLWGAPAGEEAAAAEGAAQKDAGPEPTYYVGSINSDKFHRPDCEWAQKISPANVVKFETKDEAVAAGYAPCKVCKP